MALPLPNLDDRTYADLLQEARSLILTYDPSWTDHNPSDPGMTLLELFAWLTEQLIYRANRIPDQHVRVFLKLLNGPDWQPGSELAEDIRTSVVALRQVYRAVTVEDYEALALEASADVARARCVPRRYLNASTEEDRVQPRPGHVSIIIVPHSTDPAPQPSEALRQTVWTYLDPRRILTTRHHVVGPLYAPVSAEILIARREDVPEQDVRDQVVASLEGFLHPFSGGSDGNGWPFGRDIYTSELYAQLEGILGVDYVPDIVLSSQCLPEAMRCVAAPELWHEDGELIGLGLAAHHLPRAQIDPSHIIVSALFVAVHVSLRVSPEPLWALADVRRAVKTAVKRFFHPLHGGPDGTAARHITVESLRTLVRELPEVETVIDVDLRSDPTHELRDELNTVVGIRIEARELVDVQVTAVLT